VGYQGMLKQPPCESQKRLPNHIQCRKELADGVADGAQLVVGRVAEQSKRNDCKNANESDEKYVLDEGGALFLTDNTGESGLYCADHLKKLLDPAGSYFSFPCLRNVVFVFR